MLRTKLLRGRGIGDPRLDKPAQALFIQLLQLTTAAAPEMPARRGYMVRPPLQRTVRTEQIARRCPPGKAA
ncbi:hypothetical protein GCM10011614_24880 [Novosphingobium colocasiae]|uniref:Uncharacterized protein n=1 Tax=Novosphingobium colocasiae TaxID=1256513 RepID=A0A918PH11_9SPHN|nr:hypothetical protein GCM10011614_24880 [Novosphingobium colocasiae]